MTTIATRRNESATSVAPAISPPYADGYMMPITIKLPDAVVDGGPDACEKWFVDLTLANEDAPWVMELNAQGELELKMPPYEPSDEQEGECFGELRQWNVRQGRPGVATPSSGAYRLPNGAIRYPDAAWTHADNLRPRPSAPPRARRYCPDFVVEIRSTSQSRPSDLVELLNKMQEYMDNGAKLGWLIDPIERTVRIYRAGVAEPELLQDPETLDGEGVLPGFTFDVRQLIFDLV